MNTITASGIAKWLRSVRSQAANAKALKDRIGT